MGKSLNFPKGDTPPVKPVTEKAVANSVKRITIDTEKGIKTSGEVTFADVLSLCLNAIVSNAFRVVEFTVLNESKAKPGEEPSMTVEELADYMVSVRKTMTQYLYDQMNASFTQAMETFAPDISMHPGLTELAILKAEDEIIAEYFEQLPADTLASAKAEAEKLFAQSRRALLQKIEDKKAAEEALNFTPATPEEIEEETTKRALRIIEMFNEEEVSVTEQELVWAKEWLTNHPLPCMEPAVDPEVKTDGTNFEIVAKPPLTNEECGAICSQCEHDVCKKGN